MGGDPEYFLSCDPSRKVRRLLAPKQKEFVSLSAWTAKEKNTY